jgi:predicted RNA binding protein YcfA (HicA-like mRNA interferase family)
MIPKDLTGKDLIKKLKAFGYEPIRQTGSHIRIQTEKSGKHSETIPNHKPLKQGTARGILRNVAIHFNMTLEELENQLFQK